MTPGCRVRPLVSFRAGKFFGASSRPTDGLDTGARQVSTTTIVGRQQVISTELLDLSLLTGPCDGHYILRLERSKLEKAK